MIAFLYRIAGALAAAGAAAAKFTERRPSNKGRATKTLNLRGAFSTELVRVSPVSGYRFPMSIC
jgi:hypothetical protein